MRAERRPKLFIANVLAAKERAGFGSGILSVGYSLGVSRLTAFSGRKSAV
jgi:hypothetical protein